MISPTPQPHQDPKRSGSDVASAKPSKRPKLKIACQRCRDRKVRCDGNRPVCDSCTRTQSSGRCTYAVGEADGAQDYVKSLEKRLQELESCPAPENGSSFERVVDAPFSPREQTTSFERPLSHDYQPEVIRSSMQPRLEPGRRPPRPSHSPPSTSQSVPIVHNSPCGSGSAIRNKQAPINDIANVDTEKQPPSFLGSSSAVGFMKEVYGSFQIGQQAASNESVDTSCCPDTHFPPTSSWFYDRGADDDDIVLSTQEILLPPRRTADAIMQSYFNVVHYEMPVFHKPTFLQRYEGLWTASPSTRDSIEKSSTPRSTLSYQLFHCMLNIIFALGCEFRPPDSEHSSSRKAQQNFFKRATSLLSVDIVTRPSLDLVQTLILMARYLQHKGLSDRCWVFVGMAIRAAQSIGLHLDAEGESQAQREEKRRTWSACVSLDRVQSMTFGRPLMLPNDGQVTIPQLIDDEYLTASPEGDDGQQPADVPPSVGFFVYGLKFSEINKNILQSLYHGPREQRIGDVFKKYASILEFDRTVQVYSDELPSYLHYHRTYKQQDGDDFFPRQACLLHIRLLSTRILIFRIALVHFATQPFSQTRPPLTTLQWHFMEGCLDGCYSAAQELIDLIHSNIGPTAPRGFIPPAWYTTFLTYAAGTVLVVILRALPLRTILSLEQLDVIEQSWAQCITVLEEFHRIGVAVAQNCIDTLRKVHQDGELERQAHPGPLDVARHSASMNNVELRERANFMRQGQRSFGAEGGAWAVNEQVNTETSEVWLNNMNVDWLNDLAEFGQINPPNGYNEFAGLQ